MRKVDVPEERERIGQVMRGDAMQCVLWGLGGSLLPTLLGFMMLGLGLSRLPRFSTHAERHRPPT